MLLPVTADEFFHLAAIFLIVLYNGNVQKGALSFPTSYNYYTKLSPKNK